ncbi:DUF3397 domain-containing protein [Virgibacillus litoralis]|uniref:Glucan phosphoethanolaminetransferase (Alkaline phosphatase superfamily) n=1 Tax=Virgibacillus litoralis TaxID=578221 RepID=A0ABS4HID0_9BACI|nr:glucan phosphoethanolaminetransferase (alkaline phosphatase superfamily) [Virgibacillus litoralis]
MLDFIIYFIGFIITVPVIATWIVYYISLKIYNHKWKAFHIAVNWTTILYIIAVNTLVKEVFGISFFGIVLVILIGIYTIIIIAHWKIYTEVLFSKAFKLFWRICFLLFLILYFCLVFAGIYLRIFSF